MTATTEPFLLVDAVSASYGYARALAIVSFEVAPSSAVAVLGANGAGAATLSGGQQQMLALARVLAVPPRVLIADEMSLGLAPLVVNTIFDGLETARREGVTIVLIEQFIDRALAFSDRAVILRRGEVAWQGPAAAAGPE